MHDILVCASRKPSRRSVVPHNLAAAQRRKRLETCRALLSLKRTTGWVESCTYEDGTFVPYDCSHRKLERSDKNQEPQAVPENNPGGKRCALLLLPWLCLLQLTPGGGGPGPLSHIRRSKINLIMENACPHYLKKMLKSLSVTWLPHAPY